MRWNYNTFIYTVEKIGHLWRGILPEIKKEFDFFAHFVFPPKLKSIEKELHLNKGEKTLLSINKHYRGIQ